MWFWRCAAYSCIGVRRLALRRVDASPDVRVRAGCGPVQAARGLRRTSGLTRAMSADRFKPCHRPLVACVVLRASALDAGCRRREDVVEWTGWIGQCSVEGRGGFLSRPAARCVRWPMYCLCIVVGARRIGLWLRCVFAGQERSPET